MAKNPERNFPESVREIVVRIPEGSTLSYADVAKQSGFPGAARAVGSLMKKNHDPRIPCHRVIRSCGRVGSYNRGGEKGKADRLGREDVPIERHILSGKPVWSVSRS